jgi:hypothetical protein
VSQPTIIVLEKWSATQFKARIEEPGSRYPGFLADMEALAPTAASALMSLGAGIDLQEKVLAEEDDE